MLVAMLPKTASGNFCALRSDPDGSALLLSRLQPEHYLTSLLRTPSGLFKSLMDFPLDELNFGWLTSRQN